MSKRLRGYEWFELRDRVLKRDQENCKNCGTEGNLVVHHVVPVATRGTNRLGNLITLCRRCHRAAHGQRFGLDTARMSSSSSRKIFTVDEIATVCNSLYHPLQLAVVVTLAKTGMGVGELCNLTLSDIDIDADVDGLDTATISEFEGAGLRIRYGGSIDFNNRRERKQDTLVPVDAELETALRRWLLIQPDSPSDALFLETRKWGSRLKPATVRYIFETTAREHGLYSRGSELANLTPIAMRYFFEERFRGNPDYREYILGRRSGSTVDFLQLERDYRESIFTLRQ